jgi:disulfide bond formation protein DsbB
MNLEQYSLVITLACAILLFAMLLSIIAYFFVPDTKKRLVNVSYNKYLKLIGFFALFSTAGALIYQFIYETPVCEYCWWQRIFMFPIDIIIIGSILYKIKKNEIIVGILATIGFVIASVHYYFHYQNVVLGNLIDSGCSVIGIIPSCSNTPVVVFNFVTIPLMAMVSFLAIIWLCFLAVKTKKI